MRKLILAVLLTTAAANAQGISVGVLGGVPFTDVEANTTVQGITALPKSPHFTVGPTVQLNLPFHLRLELDALVRPASFQLSSLVGNTTATEWRFPLLAQYRLGSHGPLQPFVGLGPSFEHLYQIKNAVSSGPGSILSNSPGGLVIEGGLDIKLKLFRLSGELRFTRQVNQSIVDVSQLNQAEVLVGARF